MFLLKQVYSFTEDAVVGYLTTPFLEKILSIEPFAEPVTLEERAVLVNVLNRQYGIKLDQTTMVFQRLLGGYVNDTFKVDFNHRSVVLRRLKPNKYTFADNQTFQYLKSLKGNPLFPEFLFFDEALGISAFAYVPGRHIRADEIDCELLETIAVTLKKLHSMDIADFVKHRPFNPIAFVDKKVSHYKLKEKGIIKEISMIHQHLFGQLAGITPRQALCHNDFFLNNALYNQATKQLIFVDLDNLAIGNPLFDLGSLISWNDLDKQQAKVLLEAYGIPELSEAYNEVYLFKDVADLHEYYIHLRYDGIFNKMMALKYSERLLNKYQFLFTPNKVSTFS
ncbi:MAG: aminoglycoside phosphotransferase family protein [Cellvibrionales bacterium]|nr:aminoglycoside phosphotransferase family protein [Cellvibrionales bacterium]